MKVSIIIPVFNNWNLTKACLNDLSKLPDDHEIILVDNGSTDETKNILNLSKNQLPVNFVLIRNEDNLGFAKSSNQGAKIAKGEYLIFLNNDIRVKKDLSNWTNLLTKVAENDCLVSPTVGLLNASFNFINENNIRESDDIINNVDEFKYYNRYPNSIIYLSGWCLCAKKEIFNKLIINDYDGPFTEEFFTYFEDTDLSIRAKKLNIKKAQVYIPLVHFGRMTSTKVGLQSLYRVAREKFINKWKNQL